MEKLMEALGSIIVGVVIMFILHSITGDESVAIATGMLATLIVFGWETSSHE